VRRGTLLLLAAVLLIFAGLPPAPQPCLVVVGAPETGDYIEMPGDIAVAFTTGWWGFGYWEWDGSQWYLADNRSVYFTELRLWDDAAEFINLWCDGVFVDSFYVSCLNCDAWVVEWWDGRDVVIGVWTGGEVGKIVMDWPWRDPPREVIRVSSNSRLRSYETLTSLGSSEGWCYSGGQVVINVKAVVNGEKLRITTVKLRGVLSVGPTEEGPKVPETWIRCVFLLAALALIAALVYYNRDYIAEHWKTIAAVMIVALVAAAAYKLKSTQIQLVPPTMPASISVPWKIVLLAVIIVVAALVYKYLKDNLLF